MEFCVKISFFPKKKTKTTMIKTTNYESEYSQEEIEMMLISNIDNEKINITIKMIDGLGFMFYDVWIRSYES